jgi:hypothetical protein
MKTAAQQRELMSLEIPLAIRDIGRLTNHRRVTQNPLIFPYKEEVGGSNPSTPTGEIPFRDRGFELSS